MMRLKVTFVFLGVCSLIGQILSATLFTFGNAPLFLDHHREKENSVHRGLLFSFRADDKNVICQNILSSQLYLVDNMKGEDITDYGRPYYVDPMSNYRHLHWNFFIENLFVGKQTRVIGDRWKLYIKCTGRYFKDRRLQRLQGKEEFYVSFAFKSKWYVIEAQDDNNPKHFLPLYYAVISPNIIKLEQIDLENLYVNIQQNIENLRKESTEYMKHIEERDTLFNLSTRQKMILCASILSHNKFHFERLEFSFAWMKGILDKTIDEPLDYEKQVSFTTGSKDLPPVKCILCKAVDSVTKKHSLTTNVYITPTYGSSHSAFVLIDRFIGIYVHSGFVNIPVLMPGHDDMNVDELFLNFENNQP